jgi:RND family efflux transporter MFP subunit
MTISISTHRKKQFRLWYLLLVLTGLCIIAGLVGCSQEEPPPVREVVRPIKIMEIHSYGEMLERKYPGRTRASRRAELSFKVSGRLIEMPVEEGQTVEKNQLIARLDPRDFKAEMRTVSGQINKAIAARELAKSALERVERIQAQDPGAVSGSMIDQRKEAVDKAQAEIASLSGVLEAARLQLSYTYLKSPFKGIIAKRHMDNFMDVQAKQAIVSLQDISKIEILVDLPEVIAATIKDEAIREEEVAMAEFAAAPGKKYPLRLKEFATQADPRTQTFQAVLEMKQPDEINVLSGMTALVSREERRAAKGTDLFIIPAIAVFADESSKPKVWVVSDSMTVNSRDVKTGDLTRKDSIAITDGLKSGEKIAITGITQLREGMKVRDLKNIKGYDR